MRLLTQASGCILPRYLEDAHLRGKKIVLNLSAKVKNPSVTCVDSLLNVLKDSQSFLGLPTDHFVCTWTGKQEGPQGALLCIEADLWCRRCLEDHKEQKEHDARRFIKGVGGDRIKIS